MIDDLPGFKLARDCQDLLGIQLDHLSIRVFTIYREEVQKLLDVSLAGLGITFATGSVRSQIICKFLEYDECACRVEVEHIGVLFPEVLPFLVEEARILAAEG